MTKEDERQSGLREALNAIPVSAPAGRPMRACPFCAEPIDAAAVQCPYCRRSVLPGSPPSVRAPSTSTAAKFFYVVSMLGAVVGGLIGIGGALMANGAPQEAAAAALAVSSRSRHTSSRVALML